MLELYTISKTGDSGQLETIKGFFPKIDTVYTNTFFGEGLKNNLIKVIPPDIGDRFVDFYASDLQGKSHQISDYTDKFILLDFWSMACLPCVLAAPALRELSDNYINKLVVIGINLDSRKNFWEEATKRDSITWVNLSDGKGENAGAGHLYQINAVPTYILIDPQGIIVERWMGYKSGIFKEKLSKYFIQ